MKVRVPMMVQDPLTSRYKGMSLVEHFDVDREEFFLDGPVTRRVAVLDFDPETGALVPGARFRPPLEGRTLGGYEIATEDDVYAHDFNQVSVWATVLKTMYMFDEDDALGRALMWAFGGPQLLVVPRAGEWANAYYERESQSLQFFYFPSPQGGDKPIYTSLSRDIVAHETGHAILDGIAPDLYNASTPQSLALHEAIADLTALLIAFRSEKLRETVLGQTGGSIENSTAFSSVAEEFGHALDPQAGYLRSLLNQKTLDPNDTSADSLGRPNRVARSEPHALSEVLSGALYAVMVKIHQVLRRRYAEEHRGSEFSVSGKALWVAAERFKRMILRALDYLPPGDVSFADYGRAILASDQASHPDTGEEREWIREEFARRNLAPSVSALQVETNFDHPAVKDVDLQTLVESDWAAYEFANSNRELLGIPPHIHFRVRPRLDVSKRCYYGGGRQAKIRECLFKVSWDHKETNPLGPPFPAQRQITLGTTLVIDWPTRAIRAKLTSDLGEQQQADRDRLLRRLAEDGVLRLARHATAPDGRWLRTLVRAESMNGLMRVRGSGRMLHIATGAS